MKLHYRLALFLAALSLLFLLECVRLGRYLGSEYRLYREQVSR